MESIRQLLETFPTNYPVDNVYLDGQTIATSNFINLDGDLAYFRNGAETRVFRVQDINGLDF